MIIFLYGPDTFRSRRFLHELQEKFRREVDPGLNSLDHIDGATASLKDLNEKISTGSLFVQKRMIIVDRLFQNKQEKIFAELTARLPKLADQANDIIIFRDEELDTKERPVKAAARKLFDFLKSQPYSQAFPSLTNSQLFNFLKQEAARYGKTLDSAAATELVARTGGEAWLIAGALKKLAFRTAENKINSELVQEMVSGAYDDNIFALTDALSAKNRSLATRRLAEQYAAGLSDEYILTMLIRQFKILLQLAAARAERLTPTTIASRLKLHPFIVKKGLQQINNFTLPILKNYWERLLDLDYRNKNGRGDIKTELTLLISQL